MKSCWQSEPEARPSFTALAKQLKDMENQHKVRFLLEAAKIYVRSLLIYRHALRLWPALYFSRQMDGGLQLSLSQETRKRPEKGIGGLTSS